MTTAEIFFNNVNSIALELINFYNVEYTKQIEHLASPISRWLDFRLRYIDPKPREIYLSNAFPKKLSQPAQVGIKNIINEIHQGKNVNKYQSKSLIQFNDTSGKKKSKRTDFLWASWGITHLHITDLPQPPEQFFSARKCSNDECLILFLIIQDDFVLFIDICDHNYPDLFSDISLIEKINSSWPDYLAPHQLKGIISPNSHLSNKQIGDLQKAGVMVPIVIGNKLYVPPGGGVTTAATSLKAGKKESEFRYWIGQLAELSESPENEIATHRQKNNIHDPPNIVITPEGLAIYFKETDTAFSLLTDYSKKIHNLFLPPWVIHDLFKHL